MKYVIVTTEWCSSHGILVPESARKSLDETKIIFHYDFIAPVINEKEKIKTYEHSSQELKDILKSKEWSKPIEEDSEQKCLIL